MAASGRPLPSGRSPAPAPRWFAATGPSPLLQTSAAPEDFDLIVTGDLGKVGKEILVDQFHQIGVNLGDRYTDCGVLVFDLEGQDVHAGGSGCGCSAIVLCGYLLDQLRQGKLHRILFCGTGALLSPTSSQQGESIPGVCHAVSISTERK